MNQCQGIFQCERKTLTVEGKHNCINPAGTCEHCRAIQGVPEESCPHGKSG